MEWRWIEEGKGREGKMEFLSLAEREFVDNRWMGPLAAVRK
jgi:hypothetical protein